MLKTFSSGNRSRLRRQPEVARAPSTRSRNVSLQSVPQAKVVCIGEALFDMLADDKGVPKEEVSSWTGYPGGAPCNVACGLGQLGIPVKFVSCLGQDDKGDELMDLMNSRNVDTSSVKRVTQPTRDVYVVRKADGDRVFDSFGFDTNTYCDCFISKDMLPENAIKNAKVVVTGTLGLAYPTTAEAMHAAMDMAKAAGTAVMVDINWRPVFFDEPEKALDVILPYVQKADLVKLTDDEAEWAFGIPAEEALASSSKVLKQLPNAKGVLVTAGGAGASFCFKGGPEGGNLCGEVPVYDVNVQDTTGAGDAFTCGFLAYVLAEKNAESMDELFTSQENVNKAVEFAAACGALTTENGGAIAAQPKLEEVEALVAKRYG